MAADKGRAVALNTDTGFLKLIAMIAMVMDHAGKMFFPQLAWLRIVGRLAFPIYAYCIAVGCIYTRSPLKYALRVLGLALITQPIYCMALSHVTPTMREAVAGGVSLAGAATWYVQSLQNANILFTLFAGILLLCSLREKKYIAAGLLVFFIWRFSAQLNYGWRGVALMVIFYALVDRPVASLCWSTGFMLWWGAQGGGSYQIFGFSYAMQVFAVFAIPLIYLPTKTGFKLPKWVFYLFYPAHLLVIYLLTRYL